MKVAPGCYVEYEDDEVKWPIKGRKQGSIEPTTTIYKRETKLDSIPDDFEARMMGWSESPRKNNVEPIHPRGFTVSVAYNKGGYQVLPAHDLNDKI